ncbi:MAG: aldo/keto reductase family oxidoreductase [Clostridiales bacterium]|nr:aldo/keto reductase family oxidoreductase [Clostridiales bacterium]
MKTMRLGCSTLEVPVIGLGCMRLTGLSRQEAHQYLNTCLDLGVNFFDHADIYGGGQCEELFAQALPMHADAREKIILQSKCGIVPGVMFDQSKEHILASVDGILKRLNTEYLDVLLLHRPDALVEPEEVAAAFDQLQATGKVRHFGVSNQRPARIALLQKYVRQPLLANQMQLSIPVSNMIAAGLEANMTSDGAIDRDGDVLDYCQLHNITIQAWSPYQQKEWKGTFIDNPEYAALNQAMAEIGEEYGLGKTGVATAWLLRHPAGIQVLPGTMNADRMKDIVRAAEVTLTRPEWYRLYLAAGHILP